MDRNIAPDVGALTRLPIAELRAKYAEVFGETTNANHRTWLIKRLAWRLQALAEGDLTERARRRAAELANDADLRMNPPPRPTPALAAAAEPQVLRFQPDNRLPPPGSILTRKYKGEVLQVKVLSQGFEYEGKVYGSLSAVAKAITGSHYNGYLFFRLGGQGGDT